MCTAAMWKVTCNNIRGKNHYQHYLNEKKSVVLNELSDNCSGENRFVGKKQNLQCIFVITLIFFIQILLYPELDTRWLLELS